MLLVQFVYFLLQLCRRKSILNNLGRLTVLIRLEGHRPNTGEVLLLECDQLEVLKALLRELLMSLKAVLTTPTRLSGR